MRKIIPFLTAALMMSCGSIDPRGDGYDHMDVSVPEYTGAVPAYANGLFFLTISDQWSTDDQVKILDAIDFWEKVFEDSDTVLLTSIGECDLEDDGCILPVEYDPFLKQYEDPEDPNMVVGLYLDGAMLIKFDEEEIKLITAHEIGHFLGLEHEDDGIMAPLVEDASFSLGPEGIQKLRDEDLL